MSGHFNLLSPNFSICWKWKTIRDDQMKQWLTMWTDQRTARVCSCSADRFGGVTPSLLTSSSMYVALLHNETHIHRQTDRHKGKKGRYSSSWEPHLRATGCHLPCVITQCYLPPNTSECALPNPSHAGWYSIYLPRRDGRLSWPSWLDSATAWSRTSDLSITSPMPNCCTSKTTKIQTDRQRDTGWNRDRQTDIHTHGQTDTDRQRYWDKHSVSHRHV